jgi:hypothetical protein
MGFFEGLEHNIREASEDALIKTVVSNPDQTIGDILNALEREKDAKYMLEAFKELSIGQIVHAAMKNIEAAMHAEAAAEVRAPASAPASAPEPAKKNGTPKKPAKKKAAPPKVAEEGDAPSVNLTTPEGRKAYEAAILKALKAGKHVDKKTGISSQNLRKIVGGEAPQAREILNELIDNGRVSFTGKARGTRYYLYS